jgi:REP element-mobilizing transposase RayT
MGHRESQQELVHKVSHACSRAYYVATTGGAPLAYVKQYVESQKQR